MFYQWNRNIGWSVSYPLTNSNGGATWNTSNATGTTWEESNDPCPAGWRIPTEEELQKLYDTDNVTIQWVTQNGVYGRRFTDKASGDSMFLPAAGYRFYTNGALFDVGAGGYYWSCTQHDGYYSCGMSFCSASVGRVLSPRSFGLSVRPVADN
jgi:uncharacterized protein (TIGR02145 family)